MSLPHYFHLGIDAEDYVSPSVSVRFDFSDYDLCEGLPDEELCEVLFEADFSLNKLPEECPEMIVIDGDDYGDE